MLIFCLIQRMFLMSFGTNPTIDQVSLIVIKQFESVTHLYAQIILALKKLTFMGVREINTRISSQYSIFGETELMYTLFSVVLFLNLHDV